jgi:hypothetical protein
MSVTEMTQN